MEKLIIDLSKDTEENRRIRAEGNRSKELCFRINTTMPDSEEGLAYIRELFNGTMGEGSHIQPPIQVNQGEHMHIGRNVTIMYNLLAMSMGGIWIEDNVMIAANAQLITNNHDLHNHAVLECLPITIKKNAWIGAGATILPGVTIGENAVVAAGAIVSKDVPANTVVAGVPARVIKTIE